MAEENFDHHVEIQEKYGPALSALGQISELERDLSQTDDQNLIDEIFEKSESLFEWTIDYFNKNDEPWMENWVKLKKSSFWVKRAYLDKPQQRLKYAEKILEIIKHVFDDLAENSGLSLKRVGDLYIEMIDLLIKTRAFFASPEQRANLDVLIREMSARFGEIQATQLAVQAEAADLLYAGQTLDSLIDLEDDPQEKEKMSQTRQEILEQANQKLQSFGLGRVNSLEELSKLIKAERKIDKKREVYSCRRCGATLLVNTPFCDACLDKLQRETQ